MVSKFALSNSTCTATPSKASRKLGALIKKANVTSHVSLPPRCQQKLMMNGMNGRFGMPRKVLRSVGAVITAVELSVCKPFWA